MLAYFSSGSGFPVVYLHGFCENKAIWKDFIPLLPQNYSHLAVDLPGFGESTDNPNFGSMEALAEEVAIFLKEIKVDKAIFVCHSLGGYVALALADKYPELFSGLCMFHSTAFADSEERKNTRNKTAEFIRNKGIDTFLENFVPGLFFKGRREVLVNEIRKVKEITLKTLAETAASVTLAMRDRPDRTHILEKADFPVMFIAGKDDELLNLEANKAQFFLPKNATIHLLSETGHIGMFESPEATALMVESFLKFA